MVANDLTNGIYYGIIFTRELFAIKNKFSKSCQKTVVYELIVHILGEEIEHEDEFENLMS